MIRNQQVTCSSHVAGSRFSPTTTQTLSAIRASEMHRMKDRAPLLFLRRHRAPLLQYPRLRGAQWVNMSSPGFSVSLSHSLR